MSQENVPDVFEYEIGSTIYIQKKMTLGQVKVLNKLFAEIAIPPDFTALNLFTAFSGKLSEFMGVVLYKKGTLLKERDYNGVVAEMDDFADLDIGFKVVQDFFVCNPIASYFDQMMTAFQKLMLTSRPASPQTNG